jgi:hypothetical protein
MDVCHIKSHDIKLIRPLHSSYFFNQWHPLSWLEFDAAAKLFYKCVSTVPQQGQSLLVDGLHIDRAGGKRCDGHGDVVEQS